MNKLALASQFISPAPPPDDTYLRFQLSAEIGAAFSMEQVHEVVVISPEQMTPMFNMSACVLGLLTRRSRIMWIVDLAHLLLGEPLATMSPSSFQRYTVIVIRVNQASEPSNREFADTRPRLLGFVVREVKGSIQLSPDSIQAPKGHFSPALTPCLQGSVLQDDTMLLVLDAEAITHSPLLQPR